MPTAIAACTAHRCMPLHPTRQAPPASTATDAHAVTRSHHMMQAMPYAQMYLKCGCAAGTHLSMTHVSPGVTPGLTRRCHHEMHNNIPKTNGPTTWSRHITSPACRHSLRYCACNRHQQTSNDHLIPQEGYITARRHKGRRHHQDTSIACAALTVWQTVCAESATKDRSSHRTTNAQCMTWNVQPLAASGTARPATQPSYNPHSTCNNTCPRT
jgi:hypothetical protein